MEPDKTRSSHSTMVCAIERNGSFGGRPSTNAKLACTRKSASTFRARRVPANAVRANFFHACPSCNSVLACWPAMLMWTLPVARCLERIRPSSDRAPVIERLIWRALVDVAHGAAVGELLEQGCQPRQL